MNAWTKLLLVFLFISSLQQNVKAQSGQFDTSFAKGVPGFFNGANSQASGGGVRRMVKLPDGKILVGGFFETFNGENYKGLVRLYEDGTVDKSFHTPFMPANVTGFHAYPDGRVVVSGSFSYQWGFFPRGGIITLKANGDYDSSFVGLGRGPGGDILSLGVQNDGNMIIVGSFSTYNGKVVNRIARLLPNLDIDTSFKTGIGADATIQVTEIQPDGKVLAAGNFTSFNGQLINRIVRLKQNGTIDSTFNIGSGSNGTIYCLAVQIDGKILVGGNQSSFNGQSVGRIVRLLPNGVIDTSFNSGSGFNGTVKAFSFQSDGKILVGGYYSAYNGISQHWVRLHPNGVYDSSFKPSNIDCDGIDHMLLMPAGKIILAGQFTNSGNIPRNRIARVLPNGQLDLNFNRNAGSFKKWEIGYTTHITKQSSGKMLVAGYFDLYNDINTSGVARINQDGSIDESFRTSTGDNAGIFDIQSQMDDRVIVMGVFTHFNGTARNRITRLKSNGSTDSTFNVGSGFDAQVYTAGFQNNKVLLGGGFLNYNGNATKYLTRLNQDGSWDNFFNPGGSGCDGWVFKVKVQADNKILIGGLFTKYNNISCNRIARLNADGTLDTTFKVMAGANGSVGKIEIQEDGKIIIAGGFTQYQGIGRNNIARLNADGSIDTSFNPGAGFGGVAPNCVIIQPDHKLIVMGGFTTYNGIAKNTILRINSNGSIDPTFNIGAGFTYVPATNWPERPPLVTCGLLQSDGKVIVTGPFAKYNGYNAASIARLTATNNYTFIGSGDYNSPSNWSEGLVPPNPIPSGTVVKINPMAGGSCTYLGNLTVSAGGGLTVATGVNFTVTGTLLIE